MSKPPPSAEADLLQRATCRVRRAVVNGLAQSRFGR